MILKTDRYIWKINRDGYKSKFPYMFGDIDFENVFIAYDMYNRILKDLGIVWDRKFYDSI